jgi:serine/threonine-protein kinase
VSKVQRAAAPETSRKMIRRALWGATQSEEETRAYLQERVTLLFKLMFWSFLALMGFLAATYTKWDDDAPVRRGYVYIVAAVGFVGMGFIWRGMLVRKKLSIDTLYRLDLSYSFFVGSTFGLSAYLQSDLIPSGYLSVIYSTFTVFSRTLIIPSTWRRTLVTSSLTYLPMTIAGAILAATVPQDMPPGMYVFGYLLFSVAPMVLATAGSWIIYGLRQKANVAQQLGQYTLDKKIGSGGMGTVHLAHHVLLRRPTAIKLITDDRNRPELLERFEREVQHMSQLTHPNTCAVYDYGHSLDGTFYYAMEYLGGGIDLDDLVRRHGPQSSGRVANILAQVCGALHEAHVANLIHRDIKPANIILCERGGVPDVAKVVDFGLVKDFTVNTGDTGQVVLGTPAYLAPEAMTDPGNVGPGVDIYALGAVGYYLLTGQPMFTGKTGVDVCIQHVTKPVTPPSKIAAHHISPELEAIIMRCVAKSPGDRYPSALALGDALKALPATTDWNASEARLWWADFRRIQQNVSQAVEAPTMTMRIDLGAGRT